MEHARDIELIELAAGRLDADREKALNGHLRQCAQCREKFDRVRQTWDILGAWEVPASRRGEPLGPSTEAAPREKNGRRSVLRSVGLVAALRFAAALAVAVPMGYWGGRWSTRRAPMPGPADPPAYVSTLGLDTGESLSWLVLQDEWTPTEGS
jgi:anti-sigma factor RsiW